MNIGLIRRDALVHECRLKRLTSWVIYGCTQCDPLLTTDLPPCHCEPKLRAEGVASSKPISAVVLKLIRVRDSPVRASQFLLTKMNSRRPVNRTSEFRESYQPMLLNRMLAAGAYRVGIAYRCYRLVSMDFQAGRDETRPLC